VSIATALPDRLTHHVHILEMNGESFRLATNKKAQRRQAREPNEGGTVTRGQTTAMPALWTTFRYAARGSQSTTTKPN